MRGLLLIILSALLLAGCEDFSGMRIDDSKVISLEGASCVENKIELTPLAPDGVDATVRVILPNGSISIVPTIVALDKNHVAHRFMVSFPGKKFSVSSRGANDQIVGKVISVNCP